MLLSDLSYAREQVPRPRIVPKPLPGFQHSLLVGTGQILQCWPFSREQMEVRQSHFHLGLLEHRLADQNVIRVWLSPKRDAPGEVAAVSVVPAE